MKTLQVHYQCWLEVTKHQRYRDKWLTDETYFRAIKAQFPTLESLGFDRGKMNKAISSYDGTILDDFTESNHTVVEVGIFRVSLGTKKFMVGKGAKDRLLTVQHFTL